MKAEFDRLKKKGYTDEAFHKYINNPNTKKIFTSEQLNELHSLWCGEHPHGEEINVSINNDTVTMASNVDLESMNKDELDEYAINTHGIDLDKRFKKETMIEELEDELKKQHPSVYNHEE